MDEKEEASDNNCNICKSIMPELFLQGRTNNGWFTFSVGDTTHAVYN